MTIPGDLVKARKASDLRGSHGGLETSVINLRGPSADQYIRRAMGHQQLPAPAAKAEDRSYSRLEVR